MFENSSSDNSLLTCNPYNVFIPLKHSSHAPYYSSSERRSIHPRTTFVCVLIHVHTHTRTSQSTLHFNGSSKKLLYCFIHITSINLKLFNYPHFFNRKKKPYQGKRSSAEFYFGKKRTCLFISKSVY